MEPKNDNDVFFKNERKELFDFETLKPISKFKFDLGKSFGGNDQNALFLLCFGQLLCHHSLTLLFAFTIIKIQLQGVKVSIIKLPIN